MSNQDRIAQVLEHRCPYMGLKNDGDTAYTYSHAGNYCHRPNPPEPVAPAYQSRYCLTEQHVDCPIFHENWSGRLPRDIRRGPRRRLRLNATLILVPGAIMVLSLLVALYLLNVSDRRLDQAMTGLASPDTPQVAASETSTLKPSATLSPNPTITLTDTLAATATPKATSSPAQTVTATPGDVVVFALEYPSNLRVAPASSQEVVELLPADTRLIVEGRDYTGQWLHVHQEDDPEVEGWLSFLQAPNTIDIPGLLVIPTPELEMTATSTPTSDSQLAIAFMLGAGKDSQCHPVTWTMPIRYPIKSQGTVFKAFNYLDPASVPDASAYQLTEKESTAPVKFTIQGNVLPQGCRENDLTCTGIAFTLCGVVDSKNAAAVTAEKALHLALGTQSYAEFYEDISVDIPVSFTITNP